MVAVVAKLAAILRLADALDRSYLQKIRQCSVNIKDNAMVVQATSKNDLALEEWTFAAKASFFEEVYASKEYESLFESIYFQHLREYKSLSFYTDFKNTLEDMQQSKK